MKAKFEKIKKVMILLTVCLFLTSVFSPFVSSEKIQKDPGFMKGPSYTNVQPLKKATFVNFDKESYLDDYAYLASVPTSVFKKDNTLYSNPLLFYQDKFTSNKEKEVTLNSRQGLDYFMKDWMSYCNGKMDQMTLINVDEKEIDNSWKAKKTTSINGDDPYSISSKIALNEWSYSDKAVVSVVEKDFETPNIETKNTIKRTLPASSIHEIETFNLEQTNSLNPIYHTFDIPEGYKFLYADCWWDGLLIGDRIMMPTGDPDMQIYCKDEQGWLQTTAVSAWNVYQPAGHEPAHAYIYKPGKWRIGVTDMPTEGDADYVRKNIIGNLLQLQGTVGGMIKPGVTYHVDVTMYPGIDIKIPDQTPFGCRDVEIKLKWDNPNVDLGFTLVGPSGEAIYTAFEENEEETHQKVKIHSLGECKNDEHYSVSVFSKNDIDSPLDFEIEYSWEQNISKVEGDSLASATNGAVLASSLNAPLLYTSSEKLSDKTKEALFKLGVKDIYLVNFCDHISKDVFNNLEEIANIKENFIKIENIFDSIRKISGSNDIVFSTIDPWTFWYKEELTPADETEAGLFIGPAAFVAAHHGTPVLIVDMHPELSCAVTYHNTLWEHFSHDRYGGTPSSGEMVFTGRRVYDFLDKHNFDKEGDENIITVADQFDIGASWDRVFIGVANTGRFAGSPVDSAYWISRNMFYPALIFENPALSEDKTYVTGSTSKRQGILGLLKNPIGSTLVIDTPEQMVKAENPVMCSFVTQKYRFNERASKYYGAKYECADGLVPGESVTNEPIDMGSIEKHTGKKGAYFPDMSETEMVPFYLERGGYNPVYSTQFEKVMDNINNGCIMWIHAAHGHHTAGGETEFWDPETKSGNLFNLLVGPAKQLNPKFGYDWYLGSTEEPDTMTMDIKGIIPFTNHNSLFFPPTGFDYALARKPIREKINKILFPNKENIPFEVENLYDGVTGSLSFSRKTTDMKNASVLDEGLDNLYSMGFITNICQTAYTQLQLSLIRHGSVFQIQDPWATSWYATVWRETIPRDLALGYTIGEAFARGIQHVGILYLGGGEDGNPQWWWDDKESVIYFGDPELRPYVPSTEYSDNNYWEKEDTKPVEYDEEFDINGHMPFGPTGYPNKVKQQSFLEKNMFIIAIFIVIIILILVLIFPRRKK